MVRAGRQAAVATDGLRFLSHFFFPSSLSSHFRTAEPPGGQPTRPLAQKFNQPRARERRLLTYAPQVYSWPHIDNFSSPPPAVCIRIFHRARAPPAKALAHYLSKSCRNAAKKRRKKRSEHSSASLFDYLRPRCVEKHLRQDKVLLEVFWKSA